jgi:UDP-N-acetylmuramate--alanine ligase
MEHIHLIGIGGTGLSAIAIVLLERGYQVSGSDLNPSPLLDAVKAAGATVYLGHQAGNIGNADLVVRSSAIPEDNPEVLAAAELGIPVLKRSDFLDHLLDGKHVMAIAGSHGKTTTSGMLAWILSDLDQDPSFIVGSVVANLGTNARSGSGEQFVIEADEYDHMFLGIKPDLAVITNIEHDHPDIFPTPESFSDAFRAFLKQVKPEGTVILCNEDPGAAAMAGEINKGQQLVRYGFASGGEYIARNLTNNDQAGFDFEIQINQTKAEQVYPISLRVPGKHNVLNALAAFAAADHLRLNRERIIKALEKFTGSERRFEIQGEFQGVKLIDDYAHHPTEIKTTLDAARSAYPGGFIRAVWQPHTYSRTKTLAADFIKAFDDADEVIVLDVYAAREEKPAGFSIENIAADIIHSQVIFLPDNDQAVQYLLGELTEGDILIVFSAGDAIEINQKLVSKLTARSNAMRGE